VSHLVAYLGNEPEHLECALVPARAALHSHTPEQPNGWGLGFVQGGDVLLQKRPRSDGREVDFFGLARDLKADAFIARGGLDEGGRSSADNADPFRFRWWLFGSVGVAEGFAQVRERLLSSVPDFLRRNIRGKSPASTSSTCSWRSCTTPACWNRSPAIPRRWAAPCARAWPSWISCWPASVRAARAPGGRRHEWPLSGRPRQRLPDAVSCPSRHRRLHRLPPAPGPRSLPTATAGRISHEGLRAVVVEANNTAPLLRPGWTLVPPKARLARRAGPRP
jgi:hypothetical protein